MPLPPLQAADSQVCLPMSHHGFAHCLPSLPLPKARSVPALCTTLSAPVLLAQWDGATGMACSPWCSRMAHCPTASLQPRALSPGHFPSCGAHWRRGQSCVYVMLHKQDYLNNQCEHNICYATLPIVFVESFNQQSAPTQIQINVRILTAQFCLGYVLHCIVAGLK